VISKSYVFKHECARQCFVLYKNRTKEKVNTFSAHVALHLQYNDGTKLRQMYKMDEGKSLYWFTLDLFILDQFLIQHGRQSLMSLVDFIITYLFTMHHKEHSQKHACSSFVKRIGNARRHCSFLYKFDVVKKKHMLPYINDDKCTISLFSCNLYASYAMRNKICLLRSWCW
jgi:hypothetical protein